MWAEIISIGSELLTPDRVDTNSLWITGQLNRYGIEVRHKAIWGDEVEGLGQEIRKALQRSPLVLTTGGLGPTEDDVTREAVAWALEAPLEGHPELVEELKEKFARFGRPMPPNNVKQSYVPRGAQILSNPLGTAPGLAARWGESRLFVLPGPPREMKPMFASCVEAAVSRLAGQRRVVRRVLRVIGLGESAMDERIAPIYKTVDNPRVGLLFSDLDLEVHLTATAASEEEATLLNEELITRLRPALGHHLYSEEDVSLAEVVGRRLRRQQLTLAVADAATGGLLAQRLGNVAGVADFLRGAFFAPSQETLSQWVDGKTALELSEGVRRRAGAQVGVAVLSSGAPDGAAGGRATQKFELAVSSSQEGHEVEVSYPGDPELRRSRAAQGALDLLRRIGGSRGD